MKKAQMIGMSLAIALAAISTGASAHGCLKGAAAGGVTGHFLGHHGFLGAAAGCAIGHHRATKKEQQAAAANHTQVAHR